MDMNEFKETVQLIAGNHDLSIEHRINAALKCYEDVEPEDRGAQLRNYAEMCPILVRMIQTEDSKHTYDLEYMQLLVLTAESLDELKYYRPMAQVADDALSLLRDDETPYDVYVQTMPRLLDALANSVYRHDLYELLLRYVRKVLMQDPENLEVMPYVEKMLSLHILLDDVAWLDRLLDKKLQDIIARRVDSRTLVSIIAKPDLRRLRVDPVEYTRRWEEIYYDMEDELDRRFGDEPRGMGFCFMYWSAQKELLAEKYGIEWSSPAAMNPGVMFD